MTDEPENTEQTEDVTPEEKQVALTRIQDTAAMFVADRMAGRVKRKFSDIAHALGIDPITLQSWRQSKHFMRKVQLYMAVPDLGHKRLYNQSVDEARRNCSDVVLKLLEIINDPVISPETRRKACADYFQFVHRAEKRPTSLLPGETTGDEGHTELEGSDPTEYFDALEWGKKKAE